MGKPGPKPQPTAIKRARGNPGKRPLPKDEPMPTVVERPAPPRGMRADEKKAWNQIVESLDGLRVITEADLVALELGACAIAEYRRLRKIVNRHGTTYETMTDRGSMRILVRPEVQQLADAWRRAKSMLEQFGLTPSSRTGVSRAGGGGGGDKLLEYLEGGHTRKAR